VRRSNKANQTDNFQRCLSVPVAIAPFWHRQTTLKIAAYWRR